MPVIRQYTVSQTRKVTVDVVPDDHETYEQAALRLAQDAFDDGPLVNEKHHWVHKHPEIVTTDIHRHQHIGSED